MRPVDDHEAGTHCVTCADELTRMVVQSVEGNRATAVAEGRTACVIALDLVDDVEPGEALLVHGGVALQRADDPSPRQPER